MARPDTTIIGKRVLVDNWKYLRNSEDPLVRKHIKKENAYARSMMKSSNKLAKTLYREFLNRVDVSETSHPYLESGYYYFTRNIKGKAYPLHYRRKDHSGASDELVLDENKLAKGKAFFSLGIYVISPDQSHLAYSMDASGDEVYTLYFKDLSTGKTRETEISNITDFVWAADSNSFFYVCQDERFRSDSCYQAALDRLEPILKYQEPDSLYDISLYKSCDKSKIFLLSQSKDQTEVWYLNSAHPLSGFSLIRPRQHRHIYYPDYLNGFFYFQSNLQSPGYSIFRAPEGSLSAPSWQILIPGMEEQPISGFQLFDSCIVLSRRLGGFKALSFHDPASGLQTDLFQPDYPADLAPWHNPDPGAGLFTYSLESDLVPYSIYSYDFTSRKHILLHQKPGYIGYEADKYTVKIHLVQAPDGTRIPLRLIYSTSLDLSKPQPLWLYGYGAYGDCEDPYFSASRFSLLDRGVIYAVAHIRGGGEFGELWYRMGKLQNKKNSFNDFIACMDFLIGQGITEPSKLLIEGGSAGGLLVAAVANQAWDKCRIVVADVPFVDVINTMLDPSLPLTAQEYEEWGNPTVVADLEYMLSYSPYENVRPLPYPTFLISSAWYDTRVGYWEALKWTQKLRSMSTSPNPILYRLNWKEGHTGSSNFYQGLKTYSETMAYAISIIAPR